MKKLLILLVLSIGLTSSNVAFCQVLKLKTKSFSYKQKVNDYRWSDWSKWKPTSVLVIINFDKERITIYSKETQVYDIAEYEGKTTDSDGDDTYSFFCVNEAGLTCRIRFLKLNSQNGKNQLYVDFSDLKWVYNIYTLD